MASAGSTPLAPRAWPADLAHSLRVIFLGAPGARPYFNVCLVFIPLAAAADALRWPSGVTFLLALLSMLPLAERLGYCTEELSEHVNDTVAGLMNASMGNAPELIIALFALSAGKIDVVKESLIGSVLSNLLLVMGTALVLGGARAHQQSFNNVLAPQNASLLLACSLAVFMPTGMVAAGLELRPGAALAVSRASSVLLLLLYGVYLVFQLKTHPELFEDGEEEEEEEEGAGGAGAAAGGGDEEEGEEEGESRPLTGAGASGSSSGTGLEAGAAAAAAGCDAPAAPPLCSDAALSPREPRGAPGGAAATVAVAAAAAAGAGGAGAQADGEEHLTMLGATFGLACMAALVAYVSDILVGAIEGAGRSWGISPAFIAAMLVPIAGNAAEHTSALIFAYKDRLDLALGICVGSAVQIYAFVLPLVVVVGWCINQPMSLDFKPFELGLLVFAVLITAFSLLPGRSNYLSGCVHAAAYLMMAAGYLMYSGSCPAGSVEAQSAAGGTLCSSAGGGANGTSL
jgi:Ca2+:H+ antiporter